MTPSPDAGYSQVRAIPCSLAKAPSGHHCTRVRDVRRHDEDAMTETLLRGKTAVVPRTEIDVVEDRNPLTVLGATSNVMELAEALNALGVSPQDLTSIFQQLHKAGVLHAELVIE